MAAGGLSKAAAIPLVAGWRLPFVGLLRPPAGGVAMATVMVLCEPQWGLFAHCLRPIEEI